MLLNISKLSIASLALISASAFASTTYTDFGSVSDTGTSFNEFSLNASGVTITVSGWSDTDNFSTSEGGNPLTGDDKITKATDFDKNGNGWSMENIDESNQANCGYSHSADNLGGGTGSDSCNYNDYDMFLLEFSEAVNISEITSSWLYGQGRTTSSKNTAATNNQITVAALSNNDLLGNSWSDVADTATSGFSSFTYSSTSGYYTSDLTTADANVSGVYSSYWLVGALNTVFGGTLSDEGNDGIKLSGVSFSTGSGTPPPATTVPEPASIMMFGLALVGFAASRRKVK
ncbi:exosortase-dependent surface protein XDP1 [Pseudocolwellia sp. AS88]|uniref:exosortase-dependent surface protein XDP1 n=1 Tax=Pseudocolwellia sp. AS88 TaxID=3063958 RepID=UPI0026F0BFF1|nr:exosortase-dependent surface protein XDP1 [Pseudocolwellia sp. AS88]MDO7083313.1 exosortase-dependent surface protein XDP1 [Pseudocolwellia sp. AS88]